MISRFVSVSLAVMFCFIVKPSISSSLPPVSDIIPSTSLALSSSGHGARSLIHQDAVEHSIVQGTWKPPSEGEKLTLADGTTQIWHRVLSDKDGVFHDVALSGGYAYVPVVVDIEEVMILEASAHNMVYVNGEPRTGDIYQSGWTRLPVHLHKGINDLLFSCGRTGTLQVKLSVPKASAFLDTRDLTLPDLIEGHTELQFGGIVVLNAENSTRQHLAIRVSSISSPDVVTIVPTILPLASRKIPFKVPAVGRKRPGPLELTVSLFQTENSKAAVLDTVKISIRVRRTGETYKRTFISSIDGSLQYYAVNPAHTISKTPRALFLSLHGASVEALGQAEAYSGKSWGDIVAPTNRRPYGFDWEDWGRLDTLEVLDLAKSHLHPDPRRIYLTGHSMGGHGTWQIGATCPDKFAAIGPSAGWISFWSYAGSVRPTNPSPVLEMLQRASLPSDTLALSPNYSQLGVYVLHGDADDNVPVTEARTMVAHLKTYHHDWEYHEQPGAGHWWDVSDEPGADCVDWAPLFDFFSHHTLPADEEFRQNDFTTADPGISAWSHWAGIVQQIHPLMLSSFSIRYDPGKRRFVGKTSNIAILALKLDHLDPDGPMIIDIDDHKLVNIPIPASKTIYLKHEKDDWSLLASQPTSAKCPSRCGPFKQVFRNHMLFVYGTHGTPEENSWALAKVKYDAENFWYRGNGSIDIMPDTSFHQNSEPDRNVILYGNGNTNSAWRLLLSDSPVKVQDGSGQCGKHVYRGDDLAFMFVRPRPGSSSASVGVVGGTGLKGMRLTDRQPFFSPGVEFPDCLIESSDVLLKGASSIRAAGFFGNDWSLESGDFVFQN